jgi:hypothetical protein
MTATCRSCCPGIQRLPCCRPRYKLRVLFNAVEMRWDWPVDANYHEARAYCSWRTERDAAPVAYRLVTEAEHQLLRDPQLRTEAHRVAGRGGEAGGGPGDAAAAAAAAAAGAYVRCDAIVVCRLGTCQGQMHSASPVGVLGGGGDVLAA